MYCIIAVILAVVAYFVDFPPSSLHIYNYAVLLAIVYFLSFYGLRQQVLSQEILVDEVSPVIPYRHSHLSDEDKEQIKKSILRYFEKKEVYLNPDLNMDLLSKALKIPKYQLTEVLNTTIGKNFFNLSMLIV